MGVSKRFEICDAYFRALLLLGMGMSAVGCSNKAQSFCHKLEKANVARNCRGGSHSEGPLADAEAVVEFDMVSGGQGKVFAFTSRDVFLAVVKKLGIEGKLIRMSKRGVYMHQGYVEPLVMVTLSEEATEVDERETRIALGQKPPPPQKR
jgi:hypothetical protein